MMSNYSVRSLIDKAAGIGPDTARYVEAILHPHAMANLRKAMGVVDLAGKHPVDIVEAASRQALAGSAFSGKAFKRLLETRQAECNTPRNLDHWLSLYINFKTDQTDETNTAKILF